MRLTTVASALIFALGAFAAPNPLPKLADALASNDALLPRSTPLEDIHVSTRSLHKRDWKCGNRKYKMSAILAAVAKGVACIASGEQFGRGRCTYPHEFRDDHGEFGRDDLWEYPIKEGGVIFGDQKKLLAGMDRVLFTKSGSFVHIITHEGSENGQFTKCADLG